MDWDSTVPVIHPSAGAPPGPMRRERVRQSDQFQTPGPKAPQPWVAHRANGSDRRTRSWCRAREGPGVLVRQSDQFHAPCPEGSDRGPQGARTGPTVGPVPGAVPGGLRPWAAGGANWSDSRTGSSRQARRAPAMDLIRRELVRQLDRFRAPGPEGSSHGPHTARTGPTVGPVQKVGARRAHWGADPSGGDRRPSPRPADSGGRRWPRGSRTVGPGTGGWYRHAQCPP
jgi:hypothetical protein